MKRLTVRRKPVTLRLSEPSIERIDAIAAREDVPRSDALRQMLLFASLKMPEGWTPPKKALPFD